MDWITIGYRLYFQGNVIWIIFEFGYSIPYLLCLHRSQFSPLVPKESCKPDNELQIWKKRTWRKEKIEISFYDSHWRYLQQAILMIKLFDGFNFFPFYFCWVCGGFHAVQNKQKGFCFQFPQKFLWYFVCGENFLLNFQGYHLENVRQSTANPLPRHLLHIL